MWRHALPEARSFHGPLVATESMPDSLSHLMSLIAHRRFIRSHRMFYDWSVQTETRNGETGRIVGVGPDFIVNDEEKLNGPHN